MLNILEDLKNNKLKKVAGDASFRSFYRFQDKNKNFILIHCRKQKEINLQQYSKINSFLRSYNLLAPNTFKLDLKLNYMIIEDLGDKTYFDLISKDKNKLRHYKKIVDTLIKVQSIKINLASKKIIKKSYTKNILFKESNLFFEWYATQHVNKNKIKNFKKDINIILSKIFSKITFANNYFVHRDFHVSNLMSFKKKVGIIDSQDALIGNPAYDILSLIDDVRIKTSNKLKEQILKYYLSKANKNFSLNQTAFQNDFDILSVQRSLKIIGIFYRLHLRDGKKHYLPLIPYAWSLLHRRLRNPIFNELNKVLNHYLPMSKRK